jgi:hypothetical protein
MLIDLNEVAQPTMGKRARYAVEHLPAAVALHVLSAGQPPLHCMSFPPENDAGSLRSTTTDGSPGRGQNV